MADILQTKAFSAKKELQDFLNEHPQLKPYQKAIDKLLDNAGNQHNRIVILRQLMTDKMKELRKAMHELKDCLIEFNRIKEE